MLTGSTFRVSVPAPKGEFRLLAGEPKTYVKTAESGEKRIHAFCFQLRYADLCVRERRRSAELFSASGLLEAKGPIASEEAHLVQVGIRVGSER